MKQKYLRVFQLLAFVCSALCAAHNAAGQTQPAVKVLCEIKPIENQSDKDSIINAIQTIFNGEMPADEQAFATFVDRLRQYHRCLIQERADLSTVNIGAYPTLSRNTEQVAKELERRATTSIFDALNTNAESAESNRIAAQIAFVVFKDRQQAVNFAAKAVALDAANAQANFVYGTLTQDLASVNRAIALDSGFAAAYRAKAEMLLNQSGDFDDEKIAKYRLASETIKTMLALPSAPDAEFWRAQHNVLKALLETDLLVKMATKPPRNFDNAAQKSPTDQNESLRELPANLIGATKRLRILSNPKPGYTDAARKWNVSGTVRLLVVFGADKSIQRVLAVKLQPFGLTRQAIESAKKIQFEPETINGTAVTTVKMLEYHFSLY